MIGHDFDLRSFLMSQWRKTLPDFILVFKKPEDARFHGRWDIEYASLHFVPYVINFQCRRRVPKSILANITNVHIIVAVDLNVTRTLM